MNEELKKKILDHAAALTAYANGEDVEFECEWGLGKWHDTPSPYSEISKELCYKFHRIKPKPKLRPFTLEEAHRLVGRIVRYKDLPNSCYLLTGAYWSETGVDYFIAGDTPVSVALALNELELFNNVTGEWGPCGMEVEE